MNNEMTVLHDEILDLKNELKAMRMILVENNLLKVDRTIVVNEPKLESLDVRISTLLLDYSVKPNLKGYRYLKEAIKMMYEDKRDYLSRCITKVLYPTIAQKFNDTPSRVERAMRHAVECAWYDCLREEFKNMEKKPSNSEFIALIVEKLKLDNQAESA
jgi:two-component system, response regulator, stage 0 sporulation protein A